MALIFDIDIKKLRMRMGNISQSKFGELFEPPVVYKTINRWEQDFNEKPTESYAVQLLNLYLKSYDIYYENDLTDMREQIKELQEIISHMNKKILLLEG